MPWIDRLLEQYGKLRIAGEARDLEDSRAVLAMDRDVVRAHHRRYLSDDIPAAAEENDMIHIGDHHAPVIQQPRSIGSKWWVILPALAGIAGGFGVSSWMLAGLVREAASRAIEQRATPPVQLPVRPARPLPSQRIPQDSDTQFELRLGPPSPPTS